MHHKSSLVFTVFFLFLIALPTHASWIEKEKGTIQGLMAITKVADTYFAVGNTGNIIRSTDSGLTWAVYDNNANVYWQDVATNGQTVRVVGEQGAMRESTDGGVTWGNVSAGVSENLYAIRVSQDRGYIVGAGGRILRFNSTANLWQTVTSPITTALNSVEDVGGGIAWAVGDGGILLYSADAGLNWTNKGKIADSNLKGIAFTSATTGFVVGTGGTFKKTTDSGASWSAISVSGLSTQTLYDITVFGSELIVAGDKIVLRSQDSGTTWISSDYSSQIFTFRGAYISPTSELWAVGTKDDVQSVILKWEAEAVPPSPTLFPEPVEGSTSEFESNSLIKSACPSNATVSDPCRAVYFYSTDGKRHAFPNDKVFFTWFDNFDSVKEVSSTFLASLPLGKNVTYHPGTKMVKFQSVPTVYAVSSKGTLHAIGSEQIASQLYGSDWNKKIDDISDAFIGNYVFGSKITQVTDYDVVAEKSSVLGLNENF